MANRTARTSRLWLLALIEVVAIALVVLVVARTPAPQPLSNIIRGAGLLGYVNVFLAIIATAYMREMTRFFGRAFINIHHYYVVAGLVLLSFHPIGVAVNSRSAAVFVPTLDSLLLFLTNGGRVAFWLLALGSLVALFRGQVGRKWKLIHMVTYLAFAFGTVHAWLLGRDGQILGVQVALILMALVAAGVLVVRRVQAAAQRRRIAQAKAQRTAGGEGKR
ncbi:MAG: hypothetical protein ACYC4R_13750 [Anaerolineae bacterium]